MASFSYTVLDKNGKQKKGSGEAETKEKMVNILKGDGYVVLDVTETGAAATGLKLPFGKKMPKQRDYSIYCRQFESMLNAGVTVIECLGMLAEQTENPTLKAVTKSVQISVQKGETLANAMAAEKIFPDLLVSMVRAGEASGSLEISFNRMATQFEKDAKTVAMVQKALIYPIVVLAVTICVVIVMLVVVIPNYMAMFSDMGIELPAITMAVVHMSDFIIEKWYILIMAIAVIVIGFKAFVRTEFGISVIAKATLKLPVISNFTVKSASARFARTMSTLLAAGISLVDAVEIVSEIMTNALIKAAMKETREQVMQGVPLSQPLERCGLFPPMVYQMTRIGEESGDVEGLLTKLADYYEEEVEMATQSLMAAMEPLIIVVLAGVVGPLVAACMAPMLTMYEALDSL